MFSLPKKKWKIHLLIIANAIVGCVSGMFLMAHLQQKFQVKSDNDHARLMELCSSPKIRDRLEILAITGKPFDDTDEVLIKGVCNMALGQVRAYELGSELRPIPDGDSE